MIIINYDGQATLAKAFTIVEQCDHALYNTMSLILYHCQWILANLGRLQLRRQNWQRQRWTRPYIIGLVGSRTMLRRFVFLSKSTPTP